MRKLLFFEEFTFDEFLTARKIAMIYQYFQIVTIIFAFFMQQWGVLGQDIPSVDIKHSDELFSKTLCTNTEKRLEGLYFCLKIKRRVSDEMRNRHRASVDVEYLIKIYNLAKNAAITGFK